MKELWTVEWSGSQKCFHVDPLEKTIAANLTAFLEHRSNDYQILAIVKTHAEASQMADMLRDEQMRKAA